MKKFLLLILLQLFTLPALAAVFVVTSNADSGPGTLRQALTDAAANGNTEKDYINFNLPDLSEAGRTITLLTQLPDMSSNLVIEGATQPGIKFGVSDALVQLLYQVPDTQKLSGLRAVEQHDIEIYGLYIKGVTTVSNSQTSSYGYWRGIEIKNGKNIQIGAAGKGNVVLGFSYNLVINAPDNTFEYFENLIIKDSFFGIDTDGETLSSYMPQQTGLYLITGQITIGGSAFEGNIFAQGLIIYQENNNNYTDTDPQSHYASATADVLIKNNKIGVNYLTKKTIPDTRGLTLATEQPNGKTTYTIEDNVIVNQQGFSAVYVANNGYPVYMRRNYIGTDKTLQNKLPTNGGIYITSSDRVNIGSNDPSDANYITGCKPVTVSDFAAASVNKNSFYCTVNAYPMISNGFTRPITQIKILSVDAESVKGTATPNSVIELFYSDVCGSCSPQTYFASTPADNNGNWQYSGPITGTVVASATVNNSTSEFTQTTIDVTNLKITNACNGTGGAVTGLVPQSAVSVKWVNENGALVGANADLRNVPPGKYKLLIANGNCNAETPYYQVFESFQLTTAVISRNPSCGSSDGYIKGVTALSHDPGLLTYSWKDANGTERAKTADFNNAPMGIYTLTVTSPYTGCEKTYGPITLTNTTGPNINQTNATITPSNCGESKGSITNISATGTGTLKYSWKNAQNAEVSTAKDLLNQPAGIYTLQVTDDTNCGPVYTSPITITELNGITIDESQKVITPSTCAGNNGSIKNIKVTGATSYKWYNSSGNVVSTQVDLTNVAAGNYYMIAANATCAKQTTTIAIDNHVNTNNYLYNETTAYTTCNLDNGVISLTFQSNSPQPVSYRLVNSAGQTISTALNTSGLKADTYKFYGADEYGCEKLIFTTNLNAVPALALTGTASVTADNCNIKTGSVQNVHVTGGHPPYVYSWTNSSGQIIAHTANIVNLPADNYTLSITDQTTCGLLTKTYTVNAQNDIIASPQVTDLQMCSAGDALLSVPNPSNQYIYRLYDSGSSLTPLDEQSDGKFKINVKANRSYYVSQSHGSCESSRAEVKVSVGITTVNIANTFSPNGDGINDTWKINGIENYPNAHVQIFTRSGEKVFESTGYAAAFNGTYNGKMLPVGTYYYIINLNSGCNLLSGNLTIVR